MGEAFLELEQVKVTPKLQEGLELVEIAKLQAEAAESIALADAATTGAPLDIMMERWIVDLVKQTGKRRDILTEELRRRGEYKRRERIYADFINRKRAGGGTVGESQIKLGSLDGTAFGQGTVAEVVGGIVAALVGKEAIKSNPSVSTPTKKSGGNPAPQDPGIDSQRDPVDYGKAAEDFHDKHGSWPGWDPLHRS
jgi:hypothetical protein